MAFDVALATLDQPPYVQSEKNENRNGWIPSTTAFSIPAAVLYFPFDETN